MDVATMVLMFLAVPLLLFALFRRKEKSEQQEPTFHHSMAQHANDAPETPTPSKRPRVAHHSA